MNEIKKILGSRIKQFRRKKGLTQEELAEEINMDPKNLSRIETGNIYPAADNLEAISNILGVEIWQLFHCADRLPVEQMKDFIINSLENDTKNIVNIYQYLVTTNNNIRI